MVKLIAIVRGVKKEYIKSIFEILLENEINDIEVSLSEETMGLECISVAEKAFKNTPLNLGVGTVKNMRQVDLALQAGAQYIIMPGWDENVVKYVLSKSIEVIPGVFSPAEVMQADNLNIKLVKLFPADFLGPKYVKALRGPFPGIQFLAVGGVELNTVEEFLKGGFAGFGLGSCLVPRGATSKDIDLIDKNAKEFKKIIQKFEENSIKSEI